MTNNLIRRVYEHRTGMLKGFSEKYRLKSLVYYEIFEAALAAIQREKNIKHWVRSWKVNLIETHNPSWIDLWDKITVS